ncbi:probable G-protein coupled receptor 171 isoform X1 [Xiphophorus couchianus]|uniref:probable G-protein coupled receptor 171 isoform X1 n=2 Tax=Xiphophorus couchianus TaxID=32473 RepID=UPI00101692B7|nr:probable G-protein coupled receptor 171 isoform X1 [Xiphophorus couchianus]XP_027901101.1 probable G-protein coupled receptor 171 isoform X1 [Xiphophorus couchianus]XP_027901102.1 probable G-protein coupled receptor 171 isoform X1 [Xiphophorus couchianus]XP_027901103.1 probable G-protein coupled receptor 171 isoform X1 [Xiphophorus couchianus]XP_027901104.1 probable G-protein coupled receptor 171 isoform X1 [Xiphophorus couchianus]XP_027901105.1 probable G-protein coupled receptor 171 isofo
MELITVLHSSNITPTGGPAENPCIVNDQMGPFIVLYILIFTLGLPGSLLSVWGFIQSRRSQQKHSTYVYLINLLVADILLLFALPFKILKDLGSASWKLMVFHCQASGVIIYISLYASIAFLAFIIVDRYLKDHHTARSLRLQESSFAWLLTMVVWILLLLIMVPNMVLPTKDYKVTKYLSCSSLKEKISLHWHTLTVFLNTALFLNASAAVLISSALALKRLLHSHSDPKLWLDARRVVLSVTAMALAYTLSFVPYHVVRTPYTLAQAEVIKNCQTKRQLFLGKESTLFLSLLHVCLDPLLFFNLDAAFRETVRRLLRRSRNQAVEADQQVVQEVMLPKVHAEEDTAV